MLFPEFKEFNQSEFLCVLACLGFVFILIHYLINYLPLSRFKTSRIESAYVEEPVSVIICAKNEDDNLTEFLPKVLSQNYLNFEVIVVNDCSWDNTENVIDEFSKIFPNLKKVNIKEDPYYKHGKKFAMLVGIKAAKHNRLVFIDADCYPNSNNWLNELAKGFTNEKEVVIGYGAYAKSKGFLNLLIRFDTFMIAIQYLSAAIKQKAYMGVGRNLAYNKDLFFKNKGFATHYQIPSGDDDLFVNEVANEKNVNVCIHSEAITISKPKETLKAWKLQKARHLGTAPFYKSETKSKLFFSSFSQVYFYLGLIPLLFNDNTLLIIPILIFAKSIFQIMVMNKSSQKLNEKDLLWLAPILEPLLLLMYPLFYLTKLFSKQNKWSH